MNLFLGLKIKKRTIVAIILTIILIVALNSFWLTFKPVKVDFNINGDGFLTVNVILNRKNDDIFKKVKSSEIDINLNEISDVSLNVKRIKRFKKIKIAFSNITSKKPIYLNNIVLNNKIKLDDYNKFKVTGADYIVDKNNLILKPMAKKIVLIYDENLNIISDIVFDYKLLIIISILGFLLFYKLSYYMAEFAFAKGKSRLDIIFLSIFFVFLFVPISYINNDEISEDENRTLAKWVPFILEDNQINFTFGKNVDNWFNDRFNLREFFINTYNKKLLLSKNWISKDVMKGKDDWLFLNWTESRNSYTNSVMFSDDELKSILNYLLEINEYCNKNNKKFYFMIAPDKSRIYEENYHESVKKAQEQTRAEELISYINKNSNIKAIYPKNTLISHKKDGLLYWKNDTHWNLLGAYFGYIELLKLIQKDYKFLSEYKIKGYIEETHLGDLYTMTPKTLRFNDKTVYRVPNIKNDLCKEPSELYGDVFCENKNGKLNLVMYRDSFSESLFPYFSNTFKNSRFIWSYDVISSDIDDSDIVVLEIIERILPKLVNKKMKVR